jgi:hypothetical protein
VVRDPGGRFVPGMSGNPGGQPRGLVRLRAAAREQTQKALDVLIKALDATKLYGKDGIEHPDWPARITAANAILDRGWGRPTSTTEPLDLDGKGGFKPAVNLEQLTPDELRQFRELAMKAKATETP